MKHLEAIKLLMHRYVMFNTVEFFAVMKNGEIRKMYMGQSGKPFVILNGEDSIDYVYKLTLNIVKRQVFVTVTIYVPRNIEISVYREKKYAFVDIEKSVVAEEIKFEPIGRYWYSVEHVSTKKLKKEIGKYMAILKNIEYGIVYTDNKYEALLQKLRPLNNNNDNKENNDVLVQALLNKIDEAVVLAKKLGWEEEYKKLCDIYRTVKQKQNTNIKG